MRMTDTVVYINLCTDRHIAHHCNAHQQCACVNIYVSGCASEPVQGLVVAGSAAPRVGAWLSFRRASTQCPAARGLCVGHSMCLLGQVRETACDLPARECSALCIYSRAGWSLARPVCVCVCVWSLSSGTDRLALRAPHMTAGALIVLCGHMLYRRCRTELKL